jgi:hypothetical protein
VRAIANRPVRRAAAFALVAACLLPATARGSTDRPPTDYYGHSPPANLTQMAASDHFVVHYTSESGDHNAVSPAYALRLEQYAEAAYAKEVGDWGLEPPLDDGDGKTDVYVFTDEYTGNSAQTHPDWPPPPHSVATSAWISIPANAPVSYLAPHEFFHVLQFARHSFWDWLTEPTAVWAHYNATGAGGGYPGLYQHPWNPLDCLTYTDPLGCEGDPRGYGRWIFFEYLTERFGGPSFMHEIADQMATLGADTWHPDPTQAVDRALADHDTNIESAFEGYVRSTIAADWSLPGIQHALPSTDLKGTTREVSSQTVAVDHLAARYLEFIVWTDAPCEPTTLHLEVGVPQGLGVRPVMRHLVEDAPTVVMQPGADGVARAEIPWRRCGQGSLAVLGLPNGAADGGERQFTVRTWETVDSSPDPLPPADPRSQPPTEGSPTLPPPATQLDEPGPPPVAPPPRVRLVVPRHVSVSRRTRAFTVRVRSSGPGSVRLALTRAGLTRTFVVRHGWNRLLLRLPRSLPAGRHRLVARSYSPAGEAGGTIKRLVRIAWR